jgi:hypothetical protein
MALVGAGESTFGAHHFGTAWRNGFSRAFAPMNFAPGAADRFDGAARQSPAVGGGALEAAARWDEARKAPAQGGGKSASFLRKLLQICIWRQEKQVRNREIYCKKKFAAHAAL